MSHKAIRCLLLSCLFFFAPLSRSFAQGVLQVIPPVDTAVEIVPFQTEVEAGQPARFAVRVVNPGSVEVPSSVLHLSVPSGDEIEYVDMPAGSFFHKIGEWFGILSSMIPIPAFGAHEFEVMVSTSNPPTPAGIITLTETPAVGYAGASLGLAFSSSSPALPEGGLVDVPVIVFLADLCVPVPEAVWSTLAGRLVIGPYSATCSIGQQGLHLQQAGAVAFFSMPPPLALPTVPSPYVTEPPTPGLTIPVGQLNFVSMPVLGAALTGPPGSAKVTLQSKRQPSRSSLVLEAANLPGSDTVMFNNLKAVSVDVYMDQDHDGTADDREACPADAGKRSPGACGCGVPDTDSNSNGVADCLITADLRADIMALRHSVQLLSLSKFRKQKLLRSSIKSLRTSLSGRLTQPGIQVSSSNVNLIKLGKTAEKQVAKLTKSTRNFAKNKKAAVKSLDALLKGLGV